MGLNASGVRAGTRGFHIQPHSVLAGSTCFPELPYGHLRPLTLVPPGPQIFLRHVAIRSWLRPCCSGTQCVQMHPPHITIVAVLDLALPTFQQVIPVLLVEVAFRVFRTCTNAVRFPLQDVYEGGGPVLHLLKPRLLKEGAVGIQGFQMVSCAVRVGDERLRQRSGRACRYDRSGGSSRK